MEAGRSQAPDVAAPVVILLDTNALIWLDQGHARTRALTRRAGRLYVSPASLLELEFLLEAGRIRLRGGTLEDVASSARWLVDEPPSIAWFQRAVGLGWTRDPFDRLIVAHAQLRGWKLATADRPLLDRLPTTDCLEI